MCGDIYCPSFMVCRRSQWEPYQGEDGPTVVIMSKPDGDLCCSLFQPSEFNAMARNAEAMRLWEESND
jgi:hypothetical protein